MENKFFYLSLILFIISLIFLLIPGIINRIFLHSKDRKIIVERTLYEQFSYEVYSSINKKLGTSISLKSECSPDEDIFDFNLNLDTFFDCRGIYTDDLSSNCQNKIVNNYTNCEPNSKISINNDENWNILDNDHRNLYCQYYSKFTRRISILYNTKICLSKANQFDYEYLLKNSVPRNNYQGINNECQSGFKKCGILDTKGNILCLREEFDCPKNKIEQSSEFENNNLKIQIDDNEYISLNTDNNLDIINSIIISENMPLNHEWEKMIKEIYVKLKSEEKLKRRIINGEDFQLLDSKEDYTYHLLNGFDYYSSSYLKVSHIKANNSIEGFDGNLYNLKQNLNIYTRNYIGFKNSEELDKFKLHFNDKNDTDNPLYKLSVLKHNPLITIILPVIFIVISFAYLVIKIKNIVQNETFTILFYIFFIFMILFLIAEIIIIIYHYKNYPRIHIDMDDRMKKVLDKYNYRVLINRIFRLISIVLNGISIVFISISYWK